MTLSQTVTLAFFNTGVGGVSVHRDGCAHISRLRNADVSWNAPIVSLKDIVLEVYPPQDFGYDGYDPEAWRAFDYDINIAPCVPTLPDDAVRVTPVGALTVVDGTVDAELHRCAMCSKSDGCPLVEVSATEYHCRHV